MKGKLLLLSAALLLGVVVARSQTADNKWALGAHFGVMETNSDYQRQFYTFTQGYAVAATAARYLNKSFDVNAHLFYDRTHGVDSWESGMPTWLDFKADMYNINLLAKYKVNNGYLLKEEARIAPYVLAGLGADLSFTNGMGENGKMDNMMVLAPNIYGGLGVKAQITPAVALVVQSSMMLPFTDKIDGVTGEKVKVSRKGNDRFLQNSVGLLFTLGKIKPKDSDGDGVPDKIDKCPDTPAGVKVDAEGCPLDTDKDGVPDYLDKCPDTPAGVKVDSLGCPLDTDKDNIPDYQDECPDVAGLAAFKGCPDTDGDGVPDKDDRCPDTPKGYKVDKNGCPLDTDKDGILDEEDACPDKAGLAELKGCPPDVKYYQQKYDLALAPAHFDFDSNALKPNEIAALDKLVTALTEQKDLGIELDGHADSTGDETYNQKLSERRANAVKAYLVKKGVSESQIKVQGYGELKPAYDNKTAEGRKLNRRVEFRMVELKA